MIIDIAHYASIGILFITRVYHERRARRLQKLRGQEIIHDDRSLRYLVPIMVSMVIVGCSIERYFSIKRNMFNDYFRLFGICLTIFGAFYLASIHSHLADNWTPSITKLSKQELITTGPYKIIRHPMYTCFLICFLAMFLSSGGSLPYLMIFIFALGMITYRVPTEDKLLRGIFGDAHKEWCKRTWAIIPCVY